MSPLVAISLIPGAAGVALIAHGITRALMRAAARRLQTLLAAALDHTWLDDIDTEYRQLIEESA